MIQEVKWKILKDKIRNSYNNKDGLTLSINDVITLVNVFEHQERKIISLENDVYEKSSDLHINDVILFNLFVFATSNIDSFKAFLNNFPNPHDRDLIIEKFNDHFPLIDLEEVNENDNDSIFYHMLSVITRMESC